MEQLIQDFKAVMADPTVNHKIFKKALVQTPSWQNMMDYVEFSKTAGNYRSDYEGFYILHCGEDHDISHFNGAAEFLKFMGAVYGEENPSQGCFTFVISENYRAMTDKSGIMRHTDTTDTIHWTTVGATIWTLYQDGQAHEYLVEPGDIVYIQYGTEHGVESLTPRAGIVYSGGEYHPNKD
jgi:mannose-6-phosphate isomerase-like protein (cupin superfamily)